MRSIKARDHQATQQPSYDSAPKAETPSSAELLRLGQKAFMYGQWLRFYRDSAMRLGTYDVKAVEKLVPLNPNLGEMVMGLFNRTVLGLPTKEKEVSYEERLRQVRLAEAYLAGKANYEEKDEFFLDKANSDLSRWVYFDPQEGYNLIFDTLSDGRVSKVVQDKKQNPRYQAKPNEVVALEKASRQTLTLVSQVIYGDLSKQYGPPIVNQDRLAEQGNFALAA